MKGDTFKLSPCYKTVSACCPQVSMPTPAKPVTPSNCVANIHFLAGSLKSYNLNLAHSTCRMLHTIL